MLCRKHSHAQTNHTSSKVKKGEKKEIDGDVYTYVYVCVCIYCIYIMFFKEISSAHQGCIYLIKNTEKKTVIFEILLQLKITIFYFNIL